MTTLLTIFTNCNTGAYPSGSQSVLERPLVLPEHLLSAPCKKQIQDDCNNINTVSYLSGLNMMEEILTKSNWLRFPPKPKMPS